MPRLARVPLKAALEQVYSRADLGNAMPSAQDLDEISPGIFVWQVYETKVKADLFSAALDTRAGTYLVDPTPLLPSTLRRIRQGRKTAGIFITNANHARAAVEFSEAFAIPIYVHEELRGGSDFPRAIGVHDGQTICEGLTAITIDGGPVGETALYYADNGGTMVVGDALINFEPHGFGFLPAKYCQDSDLMRRSLRKLLDCTFERVLFAHGTPIVSGARARVERLLDQAR